MPSRNPIDSGTLGVGNGPTLNDAEGARLAGALKKAKRKLITQKQAAAEIGVSERQVRRMLRSLGERGDKA